MTKHSTSEGVMYLQFIKKNTNHINFNNGDRQEFKHFEQIKKKNISLLKKGQTMFKLCLLIHVRPNQVLIPVF